MTIPRGCLLLSQPAAGSPTEPYDRLEMTMTEPQTAVTVTAQTISLLVSGQPDIDNKFGPGSIRSDSVRLSYRGQHIDARVDGRWVREGSELTNSRLDQHYRVREAADIAGWPDWLCALATLMRPGAPAVSSPLPDQTAGPVCKFDEGCHRVVPCEPGCGTPLPDQTLRDRLVAAIKASPFFELRTVDYAPNGPLLIKVKVDDLADTLMRRLPAVLPPPADRAAVEEQFGEQLDEVGATIAQQTAALAQADERVEFYEAAHARMRDRLEVTRVRVQRLHAPGVNGECQHCHHSSPCPTVQALDGPDDELRRLAAEAPKGSEVERLQEQLEESENTAEQLVRNVQTVARERESYRKAWKAEQQRRAKTVAEVRKVAEGLEGDAAAPGVVEIVRPALRDAARQIRAALDGAEAQQPDTRPRRGDQFEAWLKAQRDAFGWQGANRRDMFDAFDNLLDLYRLHADTGTPLGEHVCEGRAVGDCECLGPAVPVQPAADGTDRIVAYRSDGGRQLNCLRHVPPPAARHADCHPVTSEDLPDGGICTYPDCGADVLIPQQPAADGSGEEVDGPRTVCVCGHTRGEHIRVGGRLLCDECDGLSPDACKEFEAL